MITAEERELLKAEILETVYLNLPRMVKVYLEQTDAIKEILKNFLDKYPELAGEGQRISWRLNKKMAEFPEESPSELLESIAQEFKTPKFVETSEGLSKLTADVVGGFNENRS